MCGMGVCARDGHAAHPASPNSTTSSSPSPIFPASSAPQGEHHPAPRGAAAFCGRRFAPFGSAARHGHAPRAALPCGTVAAALRGQCDGCRIRAGVQPRPLRAHAARRATPLFARGAPNATGAALPRLACRACSSCRHLERGLGRAPPSGCGRRAALPLAGGRQGLHGGFLPRRAALQAGPRLAACLRRPCPVNRAVFSSPPPMPSRVRRSGP